LQRVNRNELAIRLLFGFVALVLTGALVLALTGAGSIGQRFGLVGGAVVLLGLGAFLRSWNRRHPDA
jgi:hypothetical protein